MSAFKSGESHWVENIVSTCYELLFGKLAEHAEDFGIVIARNDLAIVPVHQL